MNAEAAYIREAIGREEYQKALVQWNDYIQHRQRAIEAGLFSADQMQEVRELFEWSRRVLLSARAHLRDRYQQIEVAAAYNARPSARRSLLETRL